MSPLLKLCLCLSAGHLLSLFPTAASLSEEEDASIVIADFTTDDKQTKSWEILDDPVIGGTSHSAFTHLVGDGLIWQGRVAIIPFVREPGFCILRTAGRQTFPLLEHAVGIGFVIDSRHGNGDHDEMMFPLGAQVYTNAQASSGLEIYFSAVLRQVHPRDLGFREDGDAHVVLFSLWEDFVPVQNGQHVRDGPNLDRNGVAEAYRLGLSTFPSRKAGEFRFQILKIVAPVAVDSTGPARERRENEEQNH